jgi:Tol biopolymer transport system component
VRLDARARRAAQDFRRAADAFDRSTPQRSSFERFDRFRRLRERNSRIGVILVASALAIAATLLVTRAIPRVERPAAPRHQNGKLVFVRFDPRSGEPVAFTMNPDGTDVTQMFFSGFFSGHSEWPHWSPDGTQVTLFCCDTGMSPQIVGPDSGKLREFPPADPGLEQYCGFAWSPDGRRLACTGFGMTDPSRNGIYTIRSSDGGGLTRVTSNPGGEDAPGDFSPDGLRLVFVRKDNNGDTMGIFVVRVDGTGLRRITPAGMVIDWFGGSWSPSGDQILFGARADPDHRRAIWEVNADGSGLHELPITPACGGPISDSRSTACFYPGWSPDGTKIAFTRVTEDGKKSDIAIVNADGSGLVQVTNTGDADEADWGTHPLVE